MLNKEGLVSGLNIDQSSILSRMCIPCTEAKQAHQKFPKEAENHSEVTGKHFVSDVWGPAKVTSIGGGHAHLWWTWTKKFMNTNKSQLQMAK